MANLSPTAVLRIFEEVAAASRGAARVAQEPDEDGLTLLQLVPSRDSAAGISGAVEPDGSRVYLAIGRATPVEIDGEGGAFTELSSLDEIREIVEQVARGRFEEVVWSKGDVVVKATGTLILQGKPVTIHYRSLEGGPLVWIWRAFQAARKEHHRYAPYTQDFSPEE